MCYAIPGKVIGKKGKIVTVDYFGQKKTARNDFYRVSVGDYIYAQGGFVVQKISGKAALKTLVPWREIFYKLGEKDRQLAKRPKNLFERANAIRQKNLGNACCIHGILEFSNYCRNNCLYCGIRGDNKKIRRFRMSPEEIIEAAGYAITKLNFKALVLQSGEDLWFDEKKLIYIVSQIMKKTPALLILSIGERGSKLYQKLYSAGARAALLRFETSNPSLYQRHRPGHKLKDRLDLIKRLKKIGYLVFTGFLIGLPGTTAQDTKNDLMLAGSLNPEMFSFGPFLPHPETPLAFFPAPPIEAALEVIARARIIFPSSRILSTTALETLDKKNGAKRALLSGANSMMINLTPSKYRRSYEIYPGHTSVGSSAAKQIDSTIKLLQKLGRAPADLGLEVF